MLLLVLINLLTISIDATVTIAQCGVQHMCHVTEALIM